MMIKDFGARIEKIWEDMRPVTKKLIAGALQTGNAANLPTAPSPKFSYDPQSDWELSRLLTALDEQTKDAEVRKDAAKLAEIKQLAETCARVLEEKTTSAEVFIQLAERILKRNDYQRFDELTDILSARFAPAEIAEIIRQTELAQIRAVAYETLALVSAAALLPVLEDPIYADIAAAALEQQAFEYENEEAREILEQLDEE